MQIYSVRVTPEVLQTASGTRRCQVLDRVLTFGREPVFLRAAELLEELATDPHLRIERVDSAPEGAEVIDLKGERVQEPTANLKGERVQEPTAAVGLPGPETDLKGERVQEPLALKGERVQQPTATTGRKHR